MEFALLNKIEEYELKYMGVEYTLKIKQDELNNDTEVKLFLKDGTLVDDDTTEKVYEQFCMEC